VTKQISWPPSEAIRALPEWQALCKAATAHNCVNRMIVVEEILGKGADDSLRREQVATRINFEKAKKEMQEVHNLPDDLSAADVCEIFT